MTMGFDPGRWDDLRQMLGLVPGPVGRGAGQGGGYNPDGLDPYEVLGVSPGASRAEIQAAYRKLSSDYHPDRVSNMPKEFQDLAHEKMTQINAAFEMLKNVSGIDLEALIKSLASGRKPESDPIEV